MRREVGSLRWGAASWSSLEDVGAPLALELLPIVAGSVLLLGFPFHEPDLVVGQAVEPVNELVDLSVGCVDLALEY